MLRSGRRLHFSASIKSAAKTLAGGVIQLYENRENKIPGLFGRPYFFWASGAVWNALVEYSYLTADTQYDAIVSSALQFQVGEGRNFMPANQTIGIGNDDQSTWALAALTAAELDFKKPEEGE